MNIGQAIKKYRLKQGLTQTQLAIKINKTVRTIQKYEGGYIIPSISTLEKIFNINIHKLIYDSI